VSKLNKSLAVAIADTETYVLANNALQHTISAVNPDQVIIFSDAPQVWGRHTVNRIDKIRHIESYNKIITLELCKVLNCEYVLVIQYDGFVLAQDLFLQDFFEYDYIGAIWPGEEFYKVGNGGFSMRSRRLLQAVADLAHLRSAGEPEDVFICKTIRHKLETDYGIVFAPPEIASRFSQEMPSGRATFGFHGVFHLPSLYRGDPMYLLDNLPARVILGMFEYLKFGVRLLPEADRQAFDSVLQARWSQAQLASKRKPYPPLVSFVIPTYRRPEKLERLLKSIDTATGIEKEIIVIDDDAEGSAFPPCKAYGAVYLQKGLHKKGPAASRNIGAKYSSGRWLCFVDDDDYFDTGSLSLLPEMLRNLDGVLVHTDYIIEKPESDEPINTEGINRQDMLLGNRIAVGSFLIRRADLRHQFDETMLSHEDWDFLLANTEQIGLQHIPLVLVRIDKKDQAKGSREFLARTEFWKDYLAIYMRHKAPELDARRKMMLRAVGCPEQVVAGF